MTSYRLPGCLACARRLRKCFHTWITGGCDRLGSSAIAGSSASSVPLRRRKNGSLRDCRSIQPARGSDLSLDIYAGDWISRPNCESSWTTKNDTAKFDFADALFARRLRSASRRLSPPVTRVTDSELRFHPTNEMRVAGSLRPKQPIAIRTFDDPGKGSNQGALRSKLRKQHGRQ
jgi:hypothetical protein